uniref:PDE4_UCR domain-containing protein n=1 Tax=Echinostoma caproni TaxID=27848 RepID=A0A183AIM4_9TREM
LPVIDGVPPIRQILRPIGQLEAFVQNMAADVQGGVLPNVSASTGVYTGPTLVDPDQKDAIPVGGSDSLPQSASCATVVSPSSSPVLSHKRRTPGSPFDAPSSMPSDASVSTKDSSPSSMVSSEALQSPAKRRRIVNVHGSETTVLGTEAASTFPNSLNDSPPIIVCNPLSTGNRDRDSGECLPCDPSNTTGGSSSEATGSTDSSDTVSTESENLLSSSGTNTVRIDMETGEEEDEEENGDMNQERVEAQPELQSTESSTIVSGSDCTERQQSLDEQSR